jgi:glc operon protein GlcG
MTLRQYRTLGQAEAARVAAACVAAATTLGVANCIAVADTAGNLLHFVRMDGAPLLCIGIAQDKAYSVAAFNGLPTDAWWGLIEREPALVHGLVKTDRLTVFGGGKPCLVDGELVGAVGVSGGSAEQDVAVAMAGAAAVL